MPIDPSRFCKCHGKPMLRKAGDGYYRCNVKRRAASKRNAARNLYHKRRIWINGLQYGSMPTIEEAEKLRAYIQRRRHEFVAGLQARAQAEGAS